VLAKNTAFTCFNASVVMRRATSPASRQYRTLKSPLRSPSAAIVASATGIELCRKPVVYVTTSRVNARAAGGDGVEAVVGVGAAAGGFVVPLHASVRASDQARGQRHIVIQEISQCRS
jgi:hypothetical protein